MICTICRMPVVDLGVDWRGVRVVGCVGYDACGAEWDAPELEAQQRFYSLTEHRVGPRALPPISRPIRRRRLAVVR